MKKYTYIALVLFALVLSGCLASKQPVVTVNPATGQSSTNYVWSETPVVGQITGGVTTVAPIIPPPYGTLLTAIAGLFGTAVAAFVAFKNKQEANTANGVAATIIEGVEKLGTAATAVKESIHEVSVKNGNADDVHEAVQENV